MNNIITTNIINITKTDSIDNLDSELKLHILELNIAFAKKAGSYSKYPETYNNIIVETDNNNYILYGSLRGSTAKMTYLRLTQLAECLISKDGYIIKNRYGDDDLIVFYKSAF